MLSNIIWIILFNHLWGEICSYKLSVVELDAGPFMHAESPNWDPVHQVLYFVDVVEQNVHKLDYKSNELHSIHICGGEVNLVLPVLNSTRLLIAVKAGLYLLPWDSVTRRGDSALRLVTQLDVGEPDNVINEGKCDARGRLLCGSKGPQVGDDVTPDRASFYSVTYKNVQAPTVLVKPVSISNGLVWSLNNSILYYIDSDTHTIDAFDYDLLKGQISKRRTIIDIRDYGFHDKSIPDGMTIDENGNLWVAIMFGAAVLQINPDTQKIVHVYKMPVSQITSVQWGGPEMDLLFVTSSRKGLSEEELKNQPLAGSLFVLSGLNITGGPQYKFKFDKAELY